MKKRVIFSYVMFLASLGFIYLIGAGCSSKISGQFYYDLNSNGSQDSNEPNAANIKVMIKKDGETQIEGFTANDGTFAASFKGVPGEYCIVSKVSPENMTAALGMSAPIAAAPAAAPADVAAAPAAVPADGSAAGEIAIGKSKATVASQAATPSSDKGSPGDVPSDQDDDENQGSKTDEPETDKDTADRDNESKKTGEGETGKEQPVTEAYDPAKGLCKTEKKSSWQWETNPQGIKIDYNKAMADLGERIPKNCYAGQMCEVSFAYPYGCTMKIPELGEYLSYVSPSYQDVSQGSIAAKATVAAPMAEMSASNLKKNTIYLMVAANLPAGTTKQTIKVKIDCPDGPHDQSMVLNLKNEASVRVTPNLEEKGEESKMTITVENTGKAPIEDGSLTVTLSANMKITQMSNGCSAVASTMQCHGIKIGAGQTATREFIALTILIDSETSNSADIIFTSKDKGIEEIMPQISWISEAQIQELKAAEDEAADLPESPADGEPPAEL